MRIRLVTDMIDLGGEDLRTVGAYDLPLKMQMRNGERVILQLEVVATT